MIKYHFALEGNEVVPIETVDREERHAHTYKCLGCGAEMLPRLGAKNAWHFAHKGKDGDNCSSETYLHKLAKRLIKEKFDSSDEFWIQYIRSGTCSKIEDCIFRDDYQCRVEETVSYNLKEYYDTCQEEVPVKGYIADLLLTSSIHPEREPVLIEIKVTHQCTDDKLQSGLRIIEIGFDSEETIRAISQHNEWIEGYTLSGEWDRRSKVRNSILFHNFDHKASLVGKRSLPRFILYYSGKSRCTYEDCHIVKRKVDSKSIFEVTINSEWDSFFFGNIIASICIPDFKSCKICKFYKSNSNMLMETYNVCCLYKKYNTPKDPIPNYAKQCQYYSINQDFMKEYKLKLPNYVVADE